MNVPKALEHIGDAETTLMTFVQAIMEDPDDPPGLLNVVMAVLRSISRAAGALEED